MASSKSRQRALARAKTERQIARRAAAARRRRQWQAGIGTAVVLLLSVVGTVWATGGFEPDPDPVADCAWTPDTPSDGSDTSAIGLPRTTGVQKTGAKTMTIRTSQGDISTVLNAAEAPCAVESFTHLAAKSFFDSTVCVRLTDAVLECGGKGADGKAGPGYRFPEENAQTADPAATPTASSAPDPSASASPAASTAPSATADPALPQATYSRGTVVMASDAPGSNGSRFYLVHKDVKLNAGMTVLGVIRPEGQTVLDKIAAGGAEADGKPKLETKISKVEVTDGGSLDPATTPSATTAPSGSASPTTSASTTPQ